MSLLADVAAALIAILAVLGGYAAISLVLLFVLEIPTRSEHQALEELGLPLVEDLVFVVTLPFVIAVVILPVSRPVARVAGRIDAAIARVA